LSFWASTLLLAQSNPASFVLQSLVAKQELPHAQSQLDTKTQSRLVGSYGRLPLSFEANHGQTDARVKFLSRGSGYTLPHQR
jgi:hypothetical protein